MDGSNSGAVYIEQLKTVLTDMLTYANQLETDNRIEFLAEMDIALEELAEFVESSLSDELKEGLKEVSNDG